jgi:type IV secretory pathway VirB6-like protein
MPSIIKKSLLIIVASLLILSALPIYFVVNYQRNFNTQAQGSSVISDVNNDLALSEVDYFEYQNNDSDPDPFNIAININNVSFSSGVNKLFLRKGQKLLFDYKAITEVGNNCGNMQIQTTPRPAVLCRGTRDAIVPNPQCRDYVELCKFEGFTGSALQTFYKIKEPQDVTENFCQSVVKVCLPIVDNVCRTRSTPSGLILSVDAIKCCGSSGCSAPKNVDGTCGTGETTTIKTAKEILLPNICGGLNFYSATANVVKCCYSPAVVSGSSATCDIPKPLTPDTCATGQKLVYKTSSTVASTSDVNFGSCIGVSRLIITNRSDLETNPTTIPAWDGALTTLPAPPTSPPTCEENLKYAGNNVAQNIIIGEDSDVCYDLSEYTGRVADAVPTTHVKIKYEEYQGFLQNSKNAQPVSAIETLSADKPFGNLDYSNKNIITINENGQLSNLPEFTVNNNSTMKMLFVNNVDFNESFRSPNTHPETQISFNQTQTYKNGEMLKVVLCQEDANAYDDNNGKPRYQESYETKCDKYFMPVGNKKEIITKTYNSFVSTSLAPNSLTDSDFLTSEISESFNSFSPPVTIQHQVNSVDITKTAIDVYENGSQANRSPYMFDKDGLLKFMLANTANRQQTTIPTNPKEPTCHNYDNNVYCHKDFNAPFRHQPSWEADQLKHDLRFRLAFQIDDLDIKKEFTTAPSKYYPNSIPDENTASIQKGNKAYQNNTGKYTVTVKVTNPAKQAQLAVMEKLDNIVDKLSLSEMLDFQNPLGQKHEDLSSVSTETVSTRDGVFTYLVTNKTLKGIVYYSAILMILLFGFMYLMGLSKLDYQTLLAMILKIAFVFSLFSSDAWMLYYNIFAGPLVAGFDTISYATLQILSPQDLVTTANSGLHELDQAKISTYFYQSVDVITMIFNQKNHFKIMAIFFSYSYGFVYVFIIYYGFYLYLFATANAILMFLLAKIIMLILINLLPLFLLCLFFKTTKKMLDNWFSLILGYGFQQIFIIIAVSFFNIMIVYILKMILGYKICWDVILKIPQGSFGRGVPFEDINIFKFWQVSDGETGDYIPSLFHILYFLILVYAMKHFINFASTLGSSIAGGVSVADLANSIKNDINNNVASKIIRQRFNKLVGGMQNRLIDKISFGYSGKLADDRIDQGNTQIDEEREVFNSLQKKLNDYKSEHKDELLGKSDLEIRQKLEEEANKILKEQEYDGTYQDLIKRANQSKTSAATTLPGMLFDGGSASLKYGFGKATNYVSGRNMVSGRENDSGDFSADNLFNANLPRVTQQDINTRTAKINTEIEKLRTDIARLPVSPDLAEDLQKKKEAEQKIQQLEMQRAIVAMQKNTWDSMNKLRETRDKYGVEAMLIRGLGGVAVGGVGAGVGAVGGAVAGIKGGIVGGIAGGFKGGKAVGGNIYNSLAGDRDDISKLRRYGIAATAVAGGVVFGLVGGAVGTASGAVFGVVKGGAIGGVRGANRGAAAGVDGVGAFGARGESVATFGVNKVGGVSKGLYNFGVNVAFGNDRRKYIANVGSNFIGKVGAIPARARGAGSAFYAGAGNVTNATKVIAKSFASDGLNLGEEVYRSVSSDTSAGTFAVARSTGVAFRTLGAVVGGGAGAVYETYKKNNGVTDFALRFAKGLVYSPVKISAGISFYALNKAVNSYFSAYNIATNDAQYNLQETLAKHQIDKDQQVKIIEEFKEKIKPLLSKKTDLSQLSKKTDLSQLNFRSSEQNDSNLKGIHKAILDTINQDSLRNIDKTILINKFIKLAEAEKPINSIDSIKQIPGSLFSATAGVSLVGIGYGLGATEQAIRNATQDYKENQAEKAINKLIDSLRDNKESVQAVFTAEFKESLRNSKSPTETISLIETVTKKVTNVTDKVNLKLALEKYAKQLQKS